MELDLILFIRYHGGFERNVIKNLELLINISIPVNCQLVSPTLQEFDWTALRLEKTLGNHFFTSLSNLTKNAAFFLCPVTYFE